MKNHNAREPLVNPIRVCPAVRSSLPFADSQRPVTKGKTLSLFPDAKPWKTPKKNWGMKGKKPEPIETACNFFDRSFVETLSAA